MFGIWNDMTKRFVFGIAEPTQGAARLKHRLLAGNAARCWRYEVKKIPPNWKNPPNPDWPKEK